MDLFWFLGGLAVGALAVWWWRGQEQAGRLQEVQASWERKCAHLEEELRRADAQHEETKQRLREAEFRIQELEARLAGVRPSKQPSAKAEPPSDRAGEGEELERIKGIGPRLALKLRQAGILGLEDLARLDPDEAARLDDQLGLRGRLLRERWVEQARALLGG